MNKVITINLNGRAFLLEEGGYEKLQTYLQDSRTRLGEDPDKEEIITDLEQAVSEKFNRFLIAGKTVILEKEVDEVIKEMGSVQGQKTEENPTSEKSEVPGSPKRLYRVMEGAMIRGVCTGLAAYFNADVTLIRVIFVILTILTHGVGILLYVVMMIVIPTANTSKEKAQAHGQPFTAQEWVDRAKQEYNNFANKTEWKKWKEELKQRKREEKMKWRQQKYANTQSPSHPPFFSLIVAALSLFWLFGLLSLIAKGIIFGYVLSANIPLWIAILVWVCLYSFIVWPFKAARWHYTYMQDGSVHHYHNHDGFPEAMAWFAFWAIIIWVLWHFVPGSHPYFEKVSLWGQHIWAKIKR